MTRIADTEVTSVKDARTAQAFVRRRAHTASGPATATMVAPASKRIPPDICSLEGGSPKKVAVANIPMIPRNHAPTAQEASHTAASPARSGVQESHTKD